MGQAAHPGERRSVFRDDRAVAAMAVPGIVAMFGMTASPTINSAQNGADASWYLGEASVIWGAVNVDPVGIGLGATGMAIGAAGLVVGPGGAAIGLALYPSIKV